MNGRLLMNQQGAQPYILLILKRIHFKNSSKVRPHYASESALLILRKRTSSTRLPSAFKTVTSNGSMRT